MMSTVGIKKQGRINRLCRMLDQSGIRYNRKEILQLSISQMTKRILELGGQNKKPKWRAGDNL